MNKGTEDGFKKGLEYFNRALEKDPHYGLAYVGIAAYYIWISDIGMFYYARQYDQAIEQLRKAIDMDSSFWLAHEFLAHAYWGKGEFEKAIAQLQQATSLADDPMILGDLGNAYALSGKRDKAENVLNDLKELSKKRFVSPFAMVPLYASLGNKDAAFELLQKAIEDHSEYALLLKVDPKLDSLRSDPRFTELMLRVGFAP